MNQENNTFVDISGIDKALLLKALYEASKPVGFGDFDENRGKIMTKEDAQKLINEFPNYVYPHLSFDYVYGVYIKCCLSKDMMLTSQYNKINGKNAAENVVAQVKAIQKVKNESTNQSNLQVTQSFENKNNPDNDNKRNLINFKPVMAFIFVFIVGAIIGKNLENQSNSHSKSFKK